MLMSPGFPYLLPLPSHLRYHSLPFPQLLQKKSRRSKQPTSLRLNLLSPSRLLPLNQFLSTPRTRKAVQTRLRNASRQLASEVVSKIYQVSMQASKDRSLQAERRDERLRDLRRLLETLRAMGKPTLSSSSRCLKAKKSPRRNRITTAELAPIPIVNIKRHLLLINYKSRI